MLARPGGEKKTPSTVLSYESKYTDATLPTLSAGSEYRGVGKMQRWYNTVLCVRYVRTFPRALMLAFLSINTCTIATRPISAAMCKAVLLSWDTVREGRGDGIMMRTAYMKRFIRCK